LRRTFVRWDEESTKNLPGTSIATYKSGSRPLSNGQYIIAQ